MRLSRELDRFEESGKILSKVRAFVKDMPVRGKRVIDICTAVEVKIREFGANPAFPCNVDINEVAAHYTSPWNDPSTVPDSSIVKVDFGVELEGCITDTAISISLNPAYDSMIVAAETALQEAIAAVAPGRKATAIGAVVERCVNRYGFQPIRNLTGHRIERYKIHAGKSVPNVSNVEAGRFEVGEVYALEPFVTLRDGEGSVRDSDVAHIYRFVRTKGASKASVKLAEFIRDTYKTLPFASRWIMETWKEENAAGSFNDLVASRCVVGYPVLVEAGGAPVAQAEHTIVVTNDGCRVLTA